MLSALLDQTANLERATGADDGSMGTTRTWATQVSGFACAIWPAGSSLARDFYRADIVGSHVVVTDTDLGAKATDRLLIAGVYYKVNGFEKWANATVSAETVYAIDCGTRTV